MTHHTLALRHGLFLSAMFTVVAAGCVGGPEEDDESEGADFPPRLWVQMFAWIAPPKRCVLVPPG